MKKTIICIFIIISSFIIEGCNRSSKQAGHENTSTTSRPVARVYNHYLYAADIPNLFSKNKNQKDSIAIAKTYITNWIKQHLLQINAEERTDYNQDDLEKKIEEYRYSLLIYEFQKKYINEHLDTAIHEADITAYYKNHAKDFSLKRPIVKATLIQLPRDLSNQLKKIRPWIKSTTKKDKEALKTFCFRFAEHYILEEDIWANFDELIFNTPFEHITNKLSFLKNTSYAEENEQKHIYILYIREYKITDQHPPLEFVRQQITQLLLYKKKVKLITQLEKELMDKATKEKTIELYP